jgi:hypothetical protein
MGAPVFLADTNVRGPNMKEWTGVRDPQFRKGHTSVPFGCPKYPGLVWPRTSCKYWWAHLGGILYSPGSYWESSTSVGDTLLRPVDAHGKANKTIC